jgi:prefoldin subunit 5
MSKRSQNLEQLLKQKELIEEKIFKLQISLKGINKSIDKLHSKTEEVQKNS